MAHRTIEKVICLIPICLLIALSASSCGGGSDPSQPDPEEQPTDTIDPWTPDHQSDRLQIKEEHWIEMPDGVGINSFVLRPRDASTANRYPGLILITGGLSSKYEWLNENFQSNAWNFVDTGLIVLIYSARGRHISEGEENFNGYIQQDDLKSIIEWFVQRDDLRIGGIGIASASWGTTLATITLSRYPDLPVLFHVDSEGAMDRFDFTNWDDPERVADLQGHGTWDDEFWSEREAKYHIGNVTCPYFRNQTDRDHIIREFYPDAAIYMVNTAMAGTSPYVRLNDYEPNRYYDLNKADEIDWPHYETHDPLFFNSIVSAMEITTATGFPDEQKPEPEPEPDHWVPDYQPEREQVMDKFWLTAQDGIELHLLLYRPLDSSPSNQYPGIILVPGGIKDGFSWQNTNIKANAWEFVRSGLIVLTFDPRGRGLSGGEDDYYGIDGQDSFKLIVEWFNKRQDIIPGGVGISSSSLGIILAANTLGRYPDLPVRFLVDMEGGSDRYYSTNNDDPDYMIYNAGHSISDDAWWESREAITYIGSIPHPYFRLQTDFDHFLHRFNPHDAIRMVNAAMNGASPYVQLNDMTPNAHYDPDKTDYYNWLPAEYNFEQFYAMTLHAVSVTTILEE